MTVQMQHQKYKAKRALQDFRSPKANKGNSSDCASIKTFNWNEQNLSWQTATMYAFHMTSSNLSSRESIQIMPISLILLYNLSHI